MSNFTHLRNLAGAHGTVLRICHPHANNSLDTRSIELELRTIESIPGMQCIVTEQMVLPCDSILISGKVVVDEAFY